MKKNLKVLISSLMIALIFASPQAIHGMEAEVADESAFKGCPNEITFNILERAAIGNYLSDGNRNNLGGVCQNWRDIMKLDAMKKSLKKSIESIKHEKIYQRFLKGVLIYRPQEGSDDGMIILRIKDLKNPLAGTFDLSQCGDVGDYLSISTGYRQGRRAENANKVEIWLAPRFLIERDLTTTAGHFQDIYGNWSDKAPVGIFWTWGGLGNLPYYDYYITENMEALSNNNLYEKWHHHGKHIITQMMRQYQLTMQKLSCSFYELK